METVFLLCATCGKNFERRAAEQRRNARVGRKPYCSRSCTGQAVHQHLKGRWNQNLRRGNPDGRGDEYTPFRRHLSRAQRRDHSCTISLDDLREQWECQKGRCVYTGVALQIPSYAKSNDPITTASLDRIDSSLGYVPGNIQFISMATNYAKGRMSHEQMRDLCKRIAKFCRDCGDA